MMYKFLMREGDFGQEVARMQKVLGVDADGKFGPKTESALKAYQSSKGLSPDGVAGPHTLTMMGIPVTMGIDVSTWNGSVDWEKVASDGAKFAFVKLTEGRTYVSRRRDEINKARAAGLAVGAYHFGRPDTDAGLHDAVAEAHHFLEVYDRQPGDMRPMLDMEKGMKTDDSYNVRWALKFCDIVEASIGVRPLIYTARFYTQAYFLGADKCLLERLGEEDLWWAEYSEQQHKDLDPWKEWLVWQWTGSGSIAGVDGKCDVNWVAGGRFGDLF